MLTRFITLIKATIMRLITEFKKLNRLLVTAILIGITVVILGFLVYRQWDIIINYQWKFLPIPILLSFVTYSLALFWVAIVWGWIVNNLGTRLSYRKHIRYYILSNLAKRIPGTVWYVASRFQFYQTDGLDLKITAVTSAVEMVLISLAGVLVLIVFSTQTVIQYHISPIILVAVFVIGLALVHPKVIKWILQRRNVEAQRLQYKFIIQGIIAHVISWIFGGIILFEIANIIYPVSVGNIPYFINSWTFVGIISSILFFSPSNFGVTEIGLSLLLSSIIPSPIAVLIAISTRILLMIYDIIWAGLFLLINPADKVLLTRKD